MLNRYKGWPWGNHKPYWRCYQCFGLLPYSSGPITMDHENTIKAYSASPGMLGRGHSLLASPGPVWGIILFGNPGCTQKPLPFWKPQHNFITVWGVHTSDFLRSRPLAIQI